MFFCGIEKFEAVQKTPTLKGKPLMSMPGQEVVTPNVGFAIVVFSQVSPFDAAINHAAE